MDGYYYNKIAEDYNLKRKKPWRPLENYLNFLKNEGHGFNGLNLDLGCANGRNFKIFKNDLNKLIGIDNSLEFLKIARDDLRKFNSDNIQIILGDIQYLPIRSKVIENIFSIASFHHIKGNQVRKNALLQIFRLMKDNGYFLLTIWRRWQKKYRKYFFYDKLNRILFPRYKKKQRELNLKEFGDKNVPWTISSDKSGEKRIYERFYHFFSKAEVKRLLKSFKLVDVRKKGGSTDKDNLFILSQVLKH